MISLQKINKRFENNIVFDDFNMSFETGVYLITGANGSGKSTLLKIISNITKPNSGSIELNNEREIEFNNFSYVSAEDNSFFVHLTGAENLELFSLVKGNEKKSSDCPITTEIYNVIKPMLPVAFHSYSSGMKKKLNLYRAIMSDSEILIMDEPFSNLDRDMCLLLKKYIEKYQNSKVFLIATHREESFFENIQAKVLAL